MKLATARWVQCIHCERPRRSHSPYCSDYCRYKDSQHDRDQVMRAVLEDVHPRPILAKVLRTRLLQGKSSGRVGGVKGSATAIKERRTITLRPCPTCGRYSGRRFCSVVCKEVALLVLRGPEDGQE
jgi:hypothetical protein